MDKKYKDMSYREFIENVLKIKLDEYQIQVLEMFEELKEKEVIFNPSTVLYREPKWTCTGETTERNFETQIISGEVLCSPKPTLDSGLFKTGVIE